MSTRAQTAHDSHSGGRTNNTDDSSDNNIMMKELGPHTKSNCAIGAASSSQSSLKQKLRGESKMKKKIPSLSSIKAAHVNQTKNSTPYRDRFHCSKKNLCFTPSKLFEKENNVNQQNDDQLHLKSDKKRKFDSSQSKINDKSSPPPSARRTSNVGVIMSSLKKKGGKLIRTLTPPRHLQVGIQTPQIQKRRVTDHDAACNAAAGALFLSPSAQATSMTASHLTMSLSKQKLTLSPKFHNANQFSIRTTEFDPSPFQLDIPSHESVLISCKICCLMENYFDIGGFNFDFSSLMPWGGNKHNMPQKLDFLSGNASENSLLNDSTHGMKNEDSKNKVNKVLANLHDIVDDIVVEGFFREYYNDDNRESGLGRVEVCVFSSNKLRKFIVCYRCSSDVQDRPLYGTQFKKKCSMPNNASSKGTDQQEKSKDNEKDINYNHNKIQQNQKRLAQADVNETFLRAYRIQKVRENIITLLNRLTSLKPFSEVVFTGHSFSGALATLASQSFASSRPATRVYCHVFGSPIVGGRLFRDEIHSLPNLNLIRIERSTDPFVHLPESNTNHNNCQNSTNNEKNTSCTDWIHAGHCLRLMPTSSFIVTEESKRPVNVQLFRFDKYRPSSNFMKASLLSVNNLKKLKIGNEIKSYRKDLEKITSLKLAWVDSYHGEVGQSSTNGVFA